MTAVLRQMQIEPVASALTIGDWLSALGGGASPHLIEKVLAQPGFVIGSAILPGSAQPIESRTAAHVLIAGYGDVRLASAWAPSGSWRVSPHEESSILLIVALVGRLRIERGGHVMTLPTGAVGIVTDDREVIVDGVEDEGSLLVGFVPAARLRAAHAEVSARGPLTVPASPQLRATVAYTGALLLATAESGHLPAAESGDLISSMVGTLAEHALSAAGHSSRTGEVRQAALRCIERQHRVQAFGVDDIARELYISRRQLYRAFPDAGGIAGMIAQRRLQTAERVMIDRPALQLSEVAALSGFSTAGVMRAHFRRAYGTTPQRHRDAVQRPTAVPDPAEPASVPLD